MNADLLYRIGTTETDLTTGNLFRRGLPLPRQAIYNDHTGRRATGVGGESRHGYNNAQLFWQSLTADQAVILRDLIETAETSDGQGNGTLWLTLPKTTAESSGIAWIDVSGIAVMPQWAPEERLHGLVYENVILRLNDCTLQNEPSDMFKQTFIQLGVNDRVAVTEAHYVNSFQNTITDTVSVAESVTVSVV